MLFGFLCPNGAGKTTTINMLTGLARPDSGTIRVGGIDCSRNPRTAQHLVGVVPDESNLYPELTGLDNLCSCAALFGLGKRERQVRQRIADLHRTGITIFLTTHTIEEAERLCGRIAFIVSGRVVRVDTVEDLIQPSREKHRLRIAFRNIVLKDMRTYYLKPPNISWGIIFPLAWTGMFFI